MKIKEIIKLQRMVDEAGGAEDRRRILTECVGIADASIKNLEDLLSSLRKVFKQKFEAWWHNSETWLTEIVPFPIPEDHEEAKTYRISAIALLILEAALGTWMFHERVGFLLGWSILAALLAVILLASAFHGLFLLAFRRPDRPREVLGKLRRYLVFPSLIISGFCSAILLLVRIIEGKTAVFLIGALGIGLWGGTIGFVLASTALWAAARIIDWSYHFYRYYSKKEHELVMWKIARDSFFNELQPQPPPQISKPPVEKPDTSSLGKTITLSLILPFLISWLGLSSVLTSCSQPASPASAQTKEVLHEISKERLVYREMEIFIDFSGSPVNDTLVSTIHALLNSLSNIVEAWNIVKLTFYRFSDDGWNAEKILTVEFPRLTLPQPRQIDAGEFGGLKNIRDAVKNHQAAQYAEEAANTLQKHKKEIKQAMSIINESSLLPPLDPLKVRCTDINGLLKRTSQSSGTTPRLKVAITDAAECCTSSIYPVPSPKSDITFVIILVPQKPEEAEPNLRKGHEQFQARSAQLSKAVPWALVIPHFEDLKNILTEAKKM